MSDLRAPGTQPGVSKGKSESQKNQAPLASGNDGSADKVAGTIATPVTPGKTSGRKGNPVR